jgi:hypothetical protein
VFAIAKVFAVFGLLHRVLVEGPEYLTSVARSRMRPLKTG